MNDETKKRLTILLEELLTTANSESRQEEINAEVDKLSPDPFWSDYIFWSNDYLNDNENEDEDENKKVSLNYDKLFKKIAEYPNSSEYKTKTLIIKLVEQLIARDFSNASEVDMVNEINELSPDINWMNYVFADKSCINGDGSLDKEKFLNKIFNESWNENFR